MNSRLVCALALALASTDVAACSSSGTHPDGGTGAGGQAGGHAGIGGQAGGAGGQAGAGVCRAQLETCSDTQRCCAPYICAGNCVMMPVSQQDAAGTCSYPDGGAPDGAAFQGVCPSAGCPSGTVCVVEVGGVAGGGGEYCAPIPLECHGTPSCACMASCVCANGVGGRPETCSAQNGSIACDNGIR